MSRSKKATEKPRDLAAKKRPENAPKVPPGWPPTEDADKLEPISRTDLYRYMLASLRGLDYEFWRLHAAGIESPVRQITPMLVDADIRSVEKKLRIKKRANENNSAG